MNETALNTFSTLDLYFSAFLSLHGITPQLKTINGRVTFDFQVSDGFYKLSGRFNSNEAVPVASFITAVKALRGQMLTLKNENGNGNGGKRNGYNHTRQ